MVSTLGLIWALAGSSYGAVVFLAVWGVVVVARADACLALVLRAPGLWLVPALALLSVLWSQAPAATLRAAIELAMTIGIASLTAGFVRPRAFLSAVSVSLMLGAIASLLFGREGMDGLSGTVVFLGVFASKNTMAMFMSFLAIFGAAVAADRGQPGALRIAAGVAFCLSIPLLLRAHSAGAVVTTVLAFAVMGAVVFYGRLRARERVLMLVAGAVFGIAMGLIVMMLVVEGRLGMAVSGFVSGVLGKDATLTGRTVLWRIALGEIAKRPVLGVGYAGFWIQGNLLAEGIWRAFQIDDRMGFTFHDTYLNVAVELGWAGVAALVVTLWLALWRAVRMALAYPGWVGACFVTVIMCLLARSIGEVDVPSPFSFLTFLLFVIAFYGADQARRRGAGL